MQWPDLISSLQTRYRDVRSFPGDLIRFTGDHEGREVSFGGWPCRSTAGRLWLAVAVKVCPVDRLRARTSLVVSATLPIGGLAIAHDQVVLRQTLPLDGLRDADLDLSLQLLATTVASLQDPAGPHAGMFR